MIQARVPGSAGAEPGAEGIGMKGPDATLAWPPLRDAEIAAEAEEGRESTAEAGRARVTGTGAGPDATPPAAGNNPFAAVRSPPLSARGIERCSWVWPWPWPVTLGPSPANPPLTSEVEDVEESRAEGVRETGPPASPPRIEAPSTPTRRTPRVPVGVGAALPLLLLLSPSWGLTTTIGDRGDRCC